MHHDITRKCHNAQISQLSLIASFSHLSSHVAIFALRRPISIYSRSKLTQVLFPWLHHMSGWLFHHSRRSQPEDSDGAGEEEEEKKYHFIFSAWFFPFFVWCMNFLSMPLCPPPSPLQVGHISWARLRLKQRPLRVEAVCVSVLVLI